MAISRASDSSIQDGLPKYNDIWDGTTATSVFDAISHVTLNSAQRTIEFNNIPQTYTNLQIRGIVRNTSATTQTTLIAKLNNDYAAANYRPRHLLTADGSAINIYGDGSGTYPGLMLGSMFGGSNTANHFAPNIIDILDYANTNKLTTARCISGSEVNGSTVSYVSLVTGLWLNTAGVHTIEFSSYDGATLAANSSIALYGIK